MPYLIVEYTFEQPLTDEQYAGAFNALKPCLEVRNIRRLRSWLSEDHKNAICEYEAPDTQSLRDAYRAAQVGYAKVWSGKLFEFSAPKT